MKLKDNKDKILLKLNKKYLELRDSKDKEIEKKYERYFEKVLKKMEPELTKALQLCDREQEYNKTSQLTNHIWVMWWQGIENAPSLVKNNILKMKRIFGKKLHILTSENWKEYCEISKNIQKKFSDGKISLAALSDIIRCNVLKEYGGLWIDSTVILSKKFEKMILKYDNAPFFSLCTDKDYHYISKGRWVVWFIGGKANYPLFKFGSLFYSIWFEQHDSLIDYYTIDDMIAYFYKNTKFKEDIEKYTYKTDPYLLSRNMKNRFSDILIKKFNQVEEYSVQKFTYKYDSKVLTNKDSLLYYIIENMDDGINEE